MSHNVGALGGLKWVLDLLGIFLSYQTGILEPNSCSLKEQKVLLTAEPPPTSPSLLFNTESHLTVLPKLSFYLILLMLHLE